MIVEIKTDEQIQSCFEVIRELRPHVEASTFTREIKALFEDGFRLVAYFDQNEAVAAAGFRISANLAMGKYLYVDDLVTKEQHRSKQYGEQLLNYLETLAKEVGCRNLHLDSGTQRHRAHKFYLSNDMAILSYHFVKPL